MGSNFCVKKNLAFLQGWISYTLSRTEKQFDDINNGSWYPARQDRTHTMWLVIVNFRESKKLTLSATWIYYTGNAITFPSGKYSIGRKYLSTIIPAETRYRMPAYHRLDLGGNSIAEREGEIQIRD